MADTVFSITTKHLTELNDEVAIELFRKLLVAETWRLQIPQSHVHVSSAINVADGGIDASVENLDSGLRGNTILPGQTRYQIKTGESFKPWQPSQLKKELLGSTKKPATRKNLAEGVRNCLDAAGTYVLVCFGVDIVDKDRTKAKETLVALLKKCGFNSPSIDVWGAGELRSFFEVYPSLSLEVSKRDDRFLSHAMWASTEEMQRQYQKNELAERTITEIRNSLRDQKAVHIRVCGEPGVGKTRLILEATREDDLAATIVYWEKAEEFLTSQQFHDIRAGHANYSALLVIDECDFENSSRIWNALKTRPHSMPPIRLVTIHHEFDDSHNSPDVVYPAIALLGTDDIAAILKTYGAPLEVARPYGDLCSGSPRVAHIVGENLKENAPKLTSLRPTMGDVWNRYVSGRGDRASEITRRTKTVLEYISLFKKCGFAHPVADEADAVFRMINEGDPTIGRSTFDEIVRELRRRRILQGERTLYISPKLFHIWLWCEWWEAHGQTSNPLAFVGLLPPALFEWFGQMFRYAQDSQAAIAVVNSLLGPEGAFADEHFIRTDVGARFFVLRRGEPQRSSSLLRALNWHLESGPAQRLHDGETRSRRNARKNCLLLRPLFAIGVPSSRARRI